MIIENNLIFKMYLEYLELFGLMQSDMKTGM